MENTFFPRTWRGKEIKTSDEDKNLPLDQDDLIRVENKFIDVTSKFIRNIFNYEKIKVNLTKKTKKTGKVTGYFSGGLDTDDNHANYRFAAKLFNNQFYEFKVSNIPATSDSRHIQIFFRVLMQYLTYFYQSIQNDLPIENGHLKSSPSFIAKTDIWLYNIERTIVIGYIYNLFNTYDEHDSNEFKFAPAPLRYGINLVNTILDFANELSTKKIENKEIYCGFIFHDKNSEVSLNSVKSIRFHKEFDFGDFYQLKNYLEISNGQNIFFNVTKDKVTHVFITEDKFNEVYINPIGTGKRFLSKPLILSIQGNGKIFILEGRSDQSNIILQILNSKIIIRDYSFIKNYLNRCLKSFLDVPEEKIEYFSKWVISLSQKERGTSLIFCDMNSNTEKNLVKTVKINLENTEFIEEPNLKYDLLLLDYFVNPDGAVIFNSKLVPTHISTILPLGKYKESTSGGARHNSVSNFTKKMNCLGIVVSEDGPISIFNNGKRLIKF